MLEFRQLVLQRGKKILLDHANASIERGNRVGLIGRNGAGKSSLMSVLTGNSQEDGGHVSCDIKPENIAYLEQSLPDKNFTALEFVKTGDREWTEINHQLQQAEANQDGMKLAECYAKLQDIDGYTIDARAATILHGLGFCNEDFEKRVGDFSGGWQMRLQLAKVLLSRADLLLLDEPTNHLDLEAIAWFEQWLLKQNCSVILISHDRDFLDNVCTQILHLSQQQLKLYPGNYTSFITQYELLLEVQSREREKVERQKAHMQKFVDRFRAKSSKAKQAQSRIKAIERLSIAPAMQRENPFHFAFKECVPLSSPVIKVDGATGYKDKIVLDELNLSLQHDDRIALIGLNGAGKSTLIKTLANELPLIKGELTTHTKINIGYFSQQQLDALDYENSPLAHMLLQNPSITEAEARRYLGGFHFIGERVFEKVRSFSGGEKSRLALALLIYQAPNVLLLDEPTNHLDIQMREALIMALQEFQGVLILVSHDRYFVNSLANHLWLVANGTVKRFVGNLDDYQHAVLTAEHNETAPSAEKKKTTKKKITTSAGNPQKIKKLEEQIAKLTKQKQAVEKQLADSDLYLPENLTKLQQLQGDTKNIAKALIAAEEEWLRYHE